MFQDYLGYARIAQMPAAAGCGRKTGLKRQTRKTHEQMIDLSQLNNEQRIAALHQKGPMLVFAGAGSGKTRTLAYRVALLLEKGADPSSILAITFTNKAAGEMKERITGLNEQGAKVWISTFHATCARILRSDIKHLGYNSRFTILDSEDSQRALRQCVVDDATSLREIAAAISSLKDRLMDWEEADLYKDTFKEYQRKLKASNCLDFDDLISLCVKLFMERPDILAKWQRKFKHVLVDEYQDTSYAQNKLASLLAGKSESFFAVGDDDQSIYSWRGADVKNILDFEKTYPKAAVVKLEQNYRSTEYILGAANEVIAKNMARVEKSLWIDKQGGSKVSVWSCEDEIGEADAIASHIASAFAKGETCSQFAILYRANFQAKAIEEGLVRSGVPYRLIGGVKFYQRKEVKDIIAYLRALANPRDDISCLRVINTPKRGISLITQKKISNLAKEMGISFYDAATELDSVKPVVSFVAMMDSLADFAQKNSVSAIVDEVIERTGYLKSLTDEEDREARASNIELLRKKAIAFESENGGSIYDFLESVALVSDVDNYDEKANAVSVMTLHSAKGLEFPFVFLCGAAEGLLPFHTAIFDKKRLEEERRLFYVGATRAMNKLVITYPATCPLPSGSKAGGPSRFINDIPAGCMEKATRRAFAAKAPAPFPPGKAPVSSLDFKKGDRVRQAKYGEGVVESILPKGADFEVTVNFDHNGSRTLLAKFAKLKTVSRN
jgi:DNA helicase-2/ATP-dependent DNA helicase PcrA